MTDIIDRVCALSGRTRFDVVHDAVLKEYGNELGEAVDCLNYLYRANKGDIAPFIKDYCEKFIAEAIHPSLF